MDIVSLFELNQFIRQIIRLNFPEPIWVQAEIAQINMSKGHQFIELWEKGKEGDSSVARASAILWARDFSNMKRQHGKVLKEVLNEGVEVKLQIEVNFHENFGHRLHIKDIDPTWTFGKLAIKRRLTIDTLEQKGLLHRNKTIALPHVLQRIAVISSKGASGLQDFIAHIEYNPFGYHFDCTLFSTAVQGKNVRAEIEHALKNIKLRQGEFDCVAIIRGGGAKSDLSAFDHIQLCIRAAEFPLPILVGIGHEVDETVMDLVAFKSLKTPTAVADYCITHNQFYEGTILQTVQNIQNTALEALQIEKEQTTQQEQALVYFSQKKVLQAKLALKNKEKELRYRATQCLENAERALTEQAVLLKALDPQTILARGYSITSKAGTIIRSSKSVQTGDTIRTLTQDGAFDSEAI